MELILKKYAEELERQGLECLGLSFAAITDALINIECHEADEDELADNLLKHLNIEYIRNVITEPREIWIKERRIFSEFDKLSDNLLKSALKDKDKVNVIFAILERNISTGIADEEVDVEILGVSSLRPFKKALEEISIFKDDQEFQDLVDERVLEFLNDRDENGEVNIDELKKIYDGSIINMSDIARWHRIIKNSYFDKIDTYTKDDIEEVIECMKKMKTPDEMCNLISKELNKRITKREKSQNKKEIIISPKKETTKRSFNEIQQELLKYYNLSECYITSDRRISLDEIIHCVSLLNELGAHKEQLYTFIKLAYTSNNRFDINPINLYNEQYYRMEYYKEKSGLNTDFQNLQYLYQELFLLGGEDYSVGKDMLKEELSKFMKQIPSNSDYEIEQAKKMVKTRTQK